MGIISPVKTNDDQTSAYQPALNPETMTIKYVLDALEHHGTDNVPVARTEDLEKISESLKALDEEIKKSPANLRLVDI